MPLCRGVAGSSGLPAWAFSRCPAVTGCSSCGRSIGWEGSFDSSDPSPSLCSCIHPALLHLDGFPGPNERLAAALLNQEPRLSSLLNQSFKCVSLTESTLFLSFFFFFPQFSQMSGFVSHLHIIKSKLLVIEELVERRVFFFRLLLHAWV